MNDKTSINRYYKTILTFCFFSQLIVLIAMIYLLLHVNIPMLFNMLFCYIPCAFFLTIANSITIIASFIHLKKKKMIKFSHKIRIVWIICFLFCIIIIAFSRTHVSYEQKQNFENCFSLRNLISYTEEENWCFQNPTRKWGETFYIRGGEIDNPEKITAINMDPQTYQELPNCSAIYDVIVLKNVPNIFLKETQSIFLSEFNAELYSYLYKDSTKKINFQYKGADITMYSDSHLDGESERLLFIAQYKQNFLMLNLVFQDTSHQIQINKDDVLEKAVDYLKE